jgi:hypothetical protein
MKHVKKYAMQAKNFVGLVEKSIVLLSVTSDSHVLGLLLTFPITLCANLAIVLTEEK